MQETSVRFLGQDRLPTPIFLGFLGGSASKESTCNAGDLGSIPGLRRSPREGNGDPLQYFGLENSKESDTTEQLSLFLIIHFSVRLLLCIKSFIDLHQIQQEVSKLCIHSQFIFINWTISFNPTQSKTKNISNIPSQLSPIPKIITYLGMGLSRIDMSVWVQVLYLREDPRIHPVREQKWDQKEREIKNVCRRVH